MALIYNQRILDLGEHGVLALTLGSTWQSPLPAHKLGYACWHRLNDAAVVDCFAQCTRHPPFLDREMPLQLTLQGHCAFTGASDGGDGNGGSARPASDRAASRAALAMRAWHTHSGPGSTPVPV